MKQAMYFVFAGISVLLFFYTIDLIFYGTPLDAGLYFNQKIFYYHVPQAFVLFLAVIVAGVASLLYIKRRDGRYDDVAEAAGEVAVLFGAMMLVSGSIWGKAAWGVWWQWDARLTTSLLLWMLMVGYMLVRKYGGPSADRLAAGLAIFGAVNIPLVYFSVKIWRTLHPEASVVPGLQGSMRTTFWLSVLLFQIVFVLLLIARVGQSRIQRQVREVRERALDAGLLD
ncbi:MAG: cytochrome c biogenesis protein CcsA [Proteobacteria bacterium]|nr:cytochrome c biogenesis protein CcsA [Pseudomonadota bacterium]